MNSRVEGRFCVGAWVLALAALSAAPAAAQSASDVGETPFGAPSGAYEACLDAIEADPIMARERAAQWRAIGGGSPARQCEALAMMALGADREAARALTQLGVEARDLAAPDRLGVLRLAGDLWYGALEYALAQETYARAESVSPGDRRALVGLSRSAAALQDWPAAIGALDALLQQAPEDVEALTLRAAAKRATGDVDGARDDAARATDIAPGSSLSWFERGAAERAAGDEEAARDSWITASLLDPDGVAGDMARLGLQRMILGEE